MAVPVFGGVQFGRTQSANQTLESYLQAKVCLLYIPLTFCRQVFIYMNTLRLASTAERRMTVYVSVKEGRHASCTCKIKHR